MSTIRGVDYRLVEGRRLSYPRAYLCRAIRLADRPRKQRLFFMPGEGSLVGFCRPTGRHLKPCSRRFSRLCRHVSPIGTSYSLFGTACSLALSPFTSMLSAMATVLIVSPELASYLQVPTAEEDHRVIVADGSGDTLQQVMRRRPDVIIMPEDSESVEGADLLPVVRGLSDAIIIVVGTGETDKVAQALFEGADAFLAHPIDRAGLRSRLRALLRRRTAGRQMRCLNRLTPTHHRAVQAYLAVLTPVEQRLFKLLVEQNGSMVPSDRLLADVWGDKGKETSLRFYVRRLRAKLEPHELLRIFSQKGIGYRLELLHPTPTVG